MTAPGRREAHKRATREALLGAARQMFRERGYDQTTVRDIADAAHVTERTFFRYFASKEDLTHAEVLDLLPELSRRIGERPVGEPPLAAVRAAVFDLAAAGTPFLGLIFSGPPVLRRDRPTQTMRDLLFAFESGLADALEKRITNHGGTRFHAEVLARASVAALRSALIRYHLDGGPEKVPTTRLRALIVEAFEVLGAGRPPIAGDGSPQPAG